MNNSPPDPRPADFTDRVKDVARQMTLVSQHYEQLFTDLGKEIYEQIAPLTDPADAVAVCLKHIEAALAAFETHFPDPAGTACQKGCHHCCWFPIECPPQVVADIARYIETTLPADALDQLKEKLNQDAVNRIPPLMRSPCPFLNPDDTCDIYDKRPLPCQCFSSPDPGMCERSVAEGNPIPQHPVRSRIYQTATTVLLAAAKSQGLPHEQVDFIPALAEALSADNKD